VVVKRYLNAKELHELLSKLGEEEAFDRELAKYGGRISIPEFNVAYREVEGRMDAVHTDYEALRKLAQAYDPEIEVRLLVTEALSEPIVSITMVGYDLFANLEELHAATRHASSVTVTPASDPHMVFLCFDYQDVYVPISKFIAP